MFNLSRDTTPGIELHKPLYSACPFRFLSVVSCSVSLPRDGAYVLNGCACLSDALIYPPGMDQICSNCGRYGAAYLNAIAKIRWTNLSDDTIRSNLWNGLMDGLFALTTEPVNLVTFDNKHSRIEQKTIDYRCGNRSICIISFVSATVNTHHTH